jgi:hypothetical protein
LAAGRCSPPNVRNDEPKVAEREPVAEMNDAGAGSGAVRRPASGFGAPGIRLPFVALRVRRRLAHGGEDPAATDVAEM